MKNKRKELSVQEQYFLTGIIGGCLELALGVTHIMGYLLQFSIYIQTGVSVIITIVQILKYRYLAKAKCEKSDEMSNYNLMKAKATANDIMSILLAVFAISIVIFLVAYKTVTIYSSMLVSGIVLTLLGIQSLCTSIVFRRLEAE